MSIEKEAAFVDSFAQGLRNQGVQPETFVKQASQSGNPELEKIATAMVNLARARAQAKAQSGQTKQANILSKAKGMLGDAAGAVGHTARAADQTIRSQAEKGLRGVANAIPGRTEGLASLSERIRNVNPAVAGYGALGTGAAGTAAAGYGAHQAMQPEPSRLQQLQNYVGM